MLLLHEEGGYTVIETAEPASALDILHSTPHGLVVLFTYRMPPTDGEALLALAEQEAQLVGRHAFVCMTDVSRDHLPLTVIALPTRYKVPLVPKPFEVDDLLAVIEQAEQRFAQRPARASHAETEVVAATQRRRGAEAQRSRSRGRIRICIVRGHRTQTGCFGVDCSKDLFDLERLGHEGDGQLLEQGQDVR
jgi:DNA-binding NtrC family response regulator